MEENVSSIKRMLVLAQVGYYVTIIALYSTCVSNSTVHNAKNIHINEQKG